MPQLSMPHKKKGGKMESLKATPTRASSSFRSKNATVLLTNGSNTIGTSCSYIPR